MIKFEIILVCIMLLLTYTKPQKTCDIQNKYDVFITIMVPYGEEFKFSKGKVEPAIKEAFNDVINENVLNLTNFECLLESTSFNYTFIDTKCNSKLASNALVDRRDIELIKECTRDDEDRNKTKQVNVILGNSCDYTSEDVEHLASHWNWSIIFPGVRSVAYEATSDALYNSLVRPGITSKSLGDYFVALFDRYKWNTTTIVYSLRNGHGSYLSDSEDSDCSPLLSGISRQFRQLRKWERGKNYFYIDKENDSYIESDLNNILQEISSQSRISLWCVGRKTMRRVIARAHNLKMTNGDFAFIYLDAYNSNRTYKWSDVDDRPNGETSLNETADDEIPEEEMNQAFRALHVASISIPHTEKFCSFSNSVLTSIPENEKELYFANYVNPYITFYYDSIIMLLSGVLQAVSEGSQDIENGKSFVPEYLWNKKFRSLERNLEINSDGSGTVDYSLFDFNIETKQFEEAILWNVDKNFTISREIDWPGPKAPVNIPPCGKYVCDSITVVAIVVAVCLVVIFIFCVITILLLRKMLKEKRLQKESWRVDRNKISCLNERRGSLSSRSIKSSIKSSNGSQNSLNLFGLPSRQKFANVGLYNNTVVAIRDLTCGLMSSDKDIQKELQDLYAIEHQHICKFFGANDQPPNPFMITEYCSRGSLQDLVESMGDFEMDDVFKNSLINDIINGMVFIHRSKFQFHGNLKSSNCLVDGRFIVKLTDFRLHKLREGSSESNSNYYKSFENKLWFAPEVLRTQHHLAKLSTQEKQKGDTYSFGVIVQEIIYRRGVFYTGQNLQPEEIYDRVLNVMNKSKPFRPTLDDDDETIVLPEIRSLIRNCWAENPADRPTFSEIHQKIKKIFREKCLVDSLLHRLEQHNRNLEDKVEERTHQYKTEKDRADNLLYQMLPKVVAENLKRGNEVVPLSYESVTIFFSDIVGFTEISHNSNPIQVVNMLNDLYTMFDRIIERFDVYKVETIGDAYMVVSGLPNRNGNLHAREIARMSLLLLKNASNFKIEHMPNKKLKLRIGIHTGSVVAGVVGLKMPRYCLFGDTVNTASRMESNGEAFRIHISPSTKYILDDFESFVLERRPDKVFLKGLGNWETWWLVGENVAVETENVGSETPTEHFFEGINQLEIETGPGSYTNAAFEEDAFNTSQNSGSIYFGHYNTTPRKSSSEALLTNSGNKNQQQKNRRVGKIGKVDLKDSRKVRILTENKNLYESDDNEVYERKVKFNDEEVTSDKDKPPRDSGFGMSNEEIEEDDDGDDVYTKNKLVFKDTTSF